MVRVYKVRYYPCEKPLDASKDCKYSIPNVPEFWHHFFRLLMSMKVVDFIIMETNNWNLHLLQHSFSLYIVVALCFCLSDILVTLVYYCGSTMMIGNIKSSQVKSLSSKSYAWWADWFNNASSWYNIWKKIWEVNSKTICTILVWWACNSLAICINLHGRHIEVNSYA